MKTLLNTSNWLLYLLLFVTIFFVQFIDLEFVTTEKIYDAYLEQERTEKYGESYADEFDDDLAELDYLDDTDEDLGSLLFDYLFQTVFILIETIKLPYIAFFLFIGFELFHSLKGVTFKGILKVVIIGEIAMLIQDFLQYLYLLVFIPERTMEDINYSKPLSLKSLLGSDINYDGWFEHIIGYLDLFEVFYILILAWGVSSLYQKPFRDTAKSVGLFYAISQVIAILLSVFIFEVLL